MSRIRSASFIALACVVATWGHAESPPALRGAVLVLVDTLRADHLSTLGHDRPTTPSLAGLAEQGVHFDQAVSFAPWTLPAVAALLSGGPARLRRGRMQTSLVQTIRDAGYATAAVTEGGWMSPRFGVDLGFSDFREQQGAVQLLRPGERRSQRPTTGIEATFAEARSWITRHREEKFFLLIHTYEPHAPYTRATFTMGLSPGDVGKTFDIAQTAELESGALVFDDNDLHYLSALYDGGVRESDRQIGLFLEFLSSVGLRQQTAIVVTSDHGEELGDHYPARAGDHGHALYDEQVRIPLIIHDPRERHPVRHVGAQVRSMDILPTILDLLGLPPTPGSTGASLLPFMRGEETLGRVAFGGLCDSGPPSRFVRYRGYKYIELQGPDTDAHPLEPPPPAVQLFDLVSDPREQNDIAGERPELVARYGEMLRRLFRRGGSNVVELPTDIDDETTDRLRSLGYLQ